jgi:acetyltransferase-like isoleucine patch superfamily enzyme
MIWLFLNFTQALATWIYYRAGYFRACIIGVRHVDWRARISPKAVLHGVRAIGNAEIGRDVVIGAGTYVSSGVLQSGRIGRYCSVGPDVFIGPTEHRLDYWTTSPYEAQDRGEEAGITIRNVPPPVIGNGVWIGAKVVILRGVAIGDHSVVAAGAVVTTTIPPNELWGGVPAKKIRNVNIDSPEKMVNSR